MKPDIKNLRQPGSALIIFLALITLVTVLCLSLFVTIGAERSSAGLAREVAQAGTLADLAADVALARLDEAIRQGRRLEETEITTWASEPGRIHVYTISRANRGYTRTEYPLYSAPRGPDDATIPERHHVDLNKPNIAGIHPITGSLPATMRVGWTVVAQSPGQTPSASNPPLGRIGWWVDDESCKVNINVADGSRKADLYRELGAEETSGSYGFGTPTEISLQALRTTPNGTTELSQVQASEIADHGWDHGFNTISELHRLADVPAGFADANRFHLTTLSRSPDETFFHEPRIPLLPMGAERERTLVLGPTHQFQAFNQTVHSGRIQFLYPTPTQLPSISSNDGLLPILPVRPNLQGNNPFNSNPAYDNRPYLSRIAHAISGRTVDDEPFPWPAFPGTNGTFNTKYNARQIDSIALQIFDMSHRNAFVDAAGSMHNSVPSFALNGIINTDATQPRSVMGLGRTFLLTEIALLATVSNRSQTTSNGTTYQMPSLQLELHLETYLPLGFGGAPLHGHYAKGHLQQWALSAFATPGGMLNQIESSLSNGFVDTAWQDQLLRIEFPQQGSHGGFDLSGASNTRIDPDQAKAALYHPYAERNPSDNDYLGLIADTADRPVLRFLTPYSGVSSSHWDNHDIDSQSRYPGAYFTLRNQRYSTLYLGKPWNPDLHAATTGQPLEIFFNGGFQFSARTSDHTILWEATPLPFLTYLRDNHRGLAEYQAATIPVRFKLAISEAGAGQAAYHITVADPWVNKFPRDWTGTLDPQRSEITIETGGNRSNYRRGGATSIPDTFFRRTAGNQIPDPRNFDGDNPEFSPQGGGDPLSLWLPRIDTRYPKQSRFPSIGALNYIRTGMIPDDLSVAIGQQRGVPFRSLNFSATSANSQEVNGVRYPDWAMLDLFHVPFVPQKIYLQGQVEQVPRLLTNGGATEGRLNVNNPRIPHPFETEPNPPVRTAPLEALFRGIVISNQYDTDNDPVYTTVDHATLRAGVQSYLESHGPFMLPGQLAEVPEVNVAAYHSPRSARARASRSRNDLLRQVVGATTTQSNTFSIWVVAQTFHKARGNVLYDQFEPGDIVTGEVRRRYLVERFVETGIDNVPGNTNNPGPDGLVGTADDPIDAAYHPAMSYPLPYRWRIVLVDEPS